MRKFVKTFLKSVAMKIGYVVAACIILAAVLVIVMRILTPILDDHRADIEKWTAQLLDKPVSIEKVQASWYGYQPEITLNKVTVFNEAKEPIIQIDKIRVFFSIAQSLWQWKPVTSGIMVSGADINIRQTETGEYAVQGFPAFGGFSNEPYKQEAKFNDVMEWLSSQPRLILRNIDINYLPFQGPKRAVTLFNLSFQNSRTEHGIFGKAILHQEIPTEVTVGVQWQGEHPDLTKIKANVYLYISGLSLTQWAKSYSWKGWEVDDGIVSAKIWATWNRNALRKIQSSFQLYAIDLFSQTDKSHHVIHRLSGNIGWKRDQQGQEIFAGDDILIDLPSHLWPATNFYVALQRDANGQLNPKTVNIGYIDINDIQTFLFSSPLELPENIKNNLLNFKPVGALQNAIVTFNGPINDIEHISINSDFTQLGISAWKNLPAMRNLSGNVKWNGMQGNLTLQSNRTIFDYNSIFTNQLFIDQLTGDVAWLHDATKGWMITAKNLQILNTDFSVKVNGTLVVPDNTASPNIDLTGDFSLQKANNISRYLPMRIFDAGLVTWLKQAFLSGEVKNGKAILRGNLADFPFDKNNGLFEISGDVDSIDLRYAPDWPVLQKVTGHLVFSGRSMTVAADHAQMMDIPINKVKAVIPYLGDAQPQIVEIQSDEIYADMSQGLRFVHRSPLETTLGKMFTGIELTGPMTLKLGLTVPLSEANNTQVSGDITMKNAQMNMVPWHLVVDKINGQLHFTEDSTDAKNIQAQLFNKPIQINLSTIKKTKDVSIIQAQTTGNLAITDLENWLKIPFSKVAKGSTDVDVQLSFAAKEPLNIQLKSNLAGISLELPDQYGKKATETRDFAADIIVQDQQPLKMQIDYGKDLSAALVLTRKHDAFSLVGVNVHLGEGGADWPPAAGLYITGDFAQLDWDKIKNSLNTKSGNTSSLPDLPLRGIDIRAKVFNLFGQKLNDVKLQLAPGPNNWLINIVSNEVSGRIQTPTNFSTKGQINAQFDRINLLSNPSSNSPSEKIDVKSLPPIIFVANSFSFNNMPFGQVSFKTSPTSNGLAIQNLRVSSPRFDLQASGDWSQNNVTRLQGNASSNRVSEFLTSLGLDVHNFIVSKGQINFNLNWHDAPYAPSLASMGGTASLNLGSGRIVDVGDSNAKMDLGKMLSLFSLQTIPRRLSLDFSDLFQKGYSFDSVRGDFNLQNGSAYTTNFHFDGPVAKIGINGRIGFKNKDYDLMLSVTAKNVTSSLPVAATLITGNPLIGLAALGVNTVISSQVSQVTTYYYKVTGPWSKPNWQTSTR